MTSPLRMPSLLACVALAAASLTAQSIPIPLNYNFNGIVHLGEGGAPDAPAGFRSISDRALDFRNGIPNDPLLAGYQLVAAPGVLDLVHLGNRNQVDAGNWVFEPSPNGNNVGTQPTWLANADQSGPQTTVLSSPVVVVPNASIGFLYQVSNGGGAFDVTLTFQSGATLTQTLSGPDWYFGSFPGTGSVDIANPDQNLSLTEGRVDLSAFAGDALSQITFDNRSNTNGGYAIVACNVGEKATAAVIGQGCIREYGSFYEQLGTAAFDLTNTDLTAINSAAGYVVLTSPGSGPLPIGGVDPAGGTSLSLPDDGQQAVGSFGLTVGSNGWLALGPGNSNAFVPEVSVMLGNSSEAIYAWTDLQPNTAGLVVYEEDVISGQARVTYDGVPGWNTTDLCHIQIDYNVFTGDWALRFGTVGFANPEDWLVGYSPVGASLDPGPTDISAAQVILTQANDLAPLGLEPSTAPVLGANWGLQVVDIPPSTVFGVSIWGLSDPALLDLGFLGLPSCQLRSSLDVITAPWTPTGTTYAYSMAIPSAPALNGSALFTQAATFGVPTVNSFGAITSNGVQGVLGSF